MNLKDLLYLVNLVEEQHFGRAAQRCNVTQPTLSTQIKRLEQRLGVDLVDRRHGRVVPTDVGREVVALARVIINTVQAIEKVSSDSKKINHY